MLRGDRIAALITTHAGAVIAIMLVASAIMGAGLVNLEQSSGLDQFEFESEESEALAYIEEHFEIDDNQTTVQIVVREQDDALSRESFIETIELQQTIRDDPAINATLVEEPFADLASVVATAAIRAERGAELEQRQEALESDSAELRMLAGDLADALNETRALQAEYERLNASHENGEIDDETYAAEADRIETALDEIRTDTATDLSDEQFGAFAGLLADARELERERVQTQLAYENGEITEDERDATFSELSTAFDEVYGGIETAVLGPAFADLADRADALEADLAALQELDPTLEEQREQLEGMDEAAVDELVERILGEDGDRAALVFVPTDFEPGETQTDARTLFVTQTTDSDEVIAGEAPTRVVDSQLEIAEHVDAQFGDRGFAFGVGVISDEIDRSMGDSLSIVIPLALLFVVLVLTIAYRDLLDILLGLAGIVLVLLWTFGFMGWTGITFNQIMIAVPVLLVGLSIDYAIHVFMRHRERRSEEARETRRAMKIVILGLGLALVWVTVTAMIGFLANLVSPLAPIREFGIVSAFGIFATLLIFGTFVPATKVALDDLLERRGIDRQKRAFGTEGGSLTDVLATGSAIAQRAPWAVLLLVLLITAGGIYGAAQVDTEFRQEDFIADDPPKWMDHLPGPFAPGAYGVKTNLDFVNERFVRQDVATQVLLRGDITADDTLERVHAAEQAAAEEAAVVRLPDGEADAHSPITAMREVGERDEDFASTFEAADTTGDGIPDQNLATVYDAFFEAAPEQAARFIQRTDDGDYVAARLAISIQGDATAGEATAATRAVAAEMGHGERTAVATGQVTVFHVIEDALFDAVIDSLLVTLVAVFAFLMVAYRRIHGSAVLGAVTLTPIVLAVAWILGTMHLLDIPFNVVTGTITSLTIGLGVAYNIHITERFRLEMRRGHDMSDALRRAVTGTGGALLGSAATTVGGFGVLVFAILPPLQQFGIITGLTIIYAFLGSVFILPSFLVLWTRVERPRWWPPVKR